MVEGRSLGKKLLINIKPRPCVAQGAVCVSLTRPNKRRIHTLSAKPQSHEKSVHCLQLSVFLTPLVNLLPLFCISAYLLLPGGFTYIRNWQTELIWCISSINKDNKRHVQNQSSLLLPHKSVPKARVLWILPHFYCVPLFF